MKKALTLLLVFLLSLSVFVACDFGQQPEQEQQGGETKPPVVDEDLQAAYDYIKLTYKTLGTTATNFEVMKNAPVGEKMFAITWTTSNEAITITETEDGKFYVVNVPAPGDAAINYTLNFSIQNDKGEKKEGGFNLTVPAFAVNTFEEYAAAADDTPLVVQGIITGVISKSTGSETNGLFLQDAENKGGYYVFGLEADPDGVYLPGMTVRVTGQKHTNYGQYEIDNATVEMVDATINPVTPVDYTDIFAAATGTDAAELVEKQGLLVTIKGATILNVDGKYYYFQLGDNKTYIYISTSNNPTSDEALDSIKAVFDGTNYYNKADITGVIAPYSGEMTLYPVSANAVSNITVTQKPDSFKVAEAMKGDYISSIIQKDSAVTLPTKGASFEEVAVTWQIVGESTCATLSGNTLTVTIPEATQVVTLKATFTLNNEVQTKEYAVTVKGIDTITIKDADDKVAGFVAGQYTEEVFYITGIIDQITNTTHGNMHIVTTIDGAEYGTDIYGLYDINGKVLNENGKDIGIKYGSFTDYKPQVGDTITVRSVVGKYGNTTQLKEAALVSYAHNYVATVTAPTCSAQGYTTYTCKCGDTYVDNYTDKGACNYGDDDVCDVCGVKNHTHTTVATDVVVAPTCIAEGYTVYKCSDEACAYTENKDVQAATGVHTDANADYKCDVCDGQNGIYWPVDITTALSAPADTLVTITGTVTGFYEAWSSYGNCSPYITDGTNKILVFRTTTQVVLGDIVTVTGKIGAYNNVNQIAQTGSTVTVTGHDTSYDVIPELTIPEALEKEDATAVIVSGTVTQVNYSWSDSSNNMSVTISDDDGNTLYIYKLATKVGLGDVIKVKGSMATHNNTRQIAAGATAEIITPHTCSEYSDATCQNKAACVVCGTETGELADCNYVEGVCSVCGVSEGHTHSYTPVITEPTCTANGSIVYTCECNDTYTEVVPAAHKITDGVCTVCAYKAVTVAGASAEADDTNVIITGMVAKIKSAWSTQYGNMEVYIVDEAGNGFYLYRLATKVELGDVITATGKIGSYKGAKQLAQGATAVISDADASDAYKASADKYNLYLAANHKADATVALPATGSFGGAITWTVNGEAATELAIVVGNDAQSFALVATITVGESVLTKEFTVTVDSKAAIEKAALNITTSFTADGTLELPTAGTTYTDVVISWADTEGNAVTGPVTITQTNEEQIIVLIATIVSGETAVTKEFNVEVTAAGAKQWTLVTDASTLKAGDQVVIVAAGSNKALGETQNNNNRAQADITKGNNTITINDSVEILELGGSTGAWTLNADEGYLYAASTGSNHLKSQETLKDDNYGKWTIAIDANGVATIKSVGNTSRGWMRYNYQSGLFACYGETSNQQAICIYVLK